MFERFTDRARRVLVLAQEEARVLDDDFIGTEHLLLGLIHEGDGIAARALESLDISLEAVREAVGTSRARAPAAFTSRARSSSSPPFTPRAKKVLELSLREALQLGHNYIGTEHLLLGLIHEGQGVAAKVLVDLGADPATVRWQVLEILDTEQSSDGVSLSEIRRCEGMPEEAPIPFLRVGRHWRAQVARTGRRPRDYAAAWAELAHLVAERGWDIDELKPSQITVTSVDTREGPGLMITVSRLGGAGAGEKDEPPEPHAGHPPG